MFEKIVKVKKLEKIRNYKPLDKIDLIIIHYVIITHDNGFKTIGMQII